MNHIGMWGLTRASLLAMSMSLITVGVAEAQPQANSAAAEALFEQGRSLMKQGNYAQACPKLAESQRLDPGLGTLLNLGVCYEKDGRTASAWATFKDAKTMARKQGESGRVKFAEQHISQLTPVLSRLEVSVTASEEQAGLKVLVDGMQLGRASWGVALPMDPGAHGAGDSAGVSDLEVDGCRWKAWGQQASRGAAFGQGGGREREQAWSGCGVVVLQGETRTFGAYEREQA